MKRTLLVFCFQFALILNLASGADSPRNPFDTTTATVGHIGKNEETPVNQLLTPAGIWIPLPGMRPNALALSPNGKLLVTSGLTNELLALDAASGKILQYVPFPEEKGEEHHGAVSSLVQGDDERPKLSLTGITFSPDGQRIYLSDVNGSIKVFEVEKDDRVMPLRSLKLPGNKLTEHGNDIPTGIAVSLDSKTIYVALNVANKVLELDASTGKIQRSWRTGNAPYGVVLCGNKLYVSNWGGRLPDAHSVVGPIGTNGTVRVDEHSVASEGSVSVFDLTGDNPSAEIITGRHACALALSPDEKYLAVANAAEDTISIIDTGTDQIIETICARQKPGDAFGAQPNALAFDKRGKKLFVCNGTQNAVAIFKFEPGNSQMLGLIPVGWFPGAIAFDSHHDMLEVANIKDISTVKQTPTRNRGNGEGFNTRQYCGSLSLIRVPWQHQLKKYTRTALDDLRYPLLAQAKLPPRENQPAQPVPERIGEPSVFQHVIYIIKENRTYDQVLGDIAEGNGQSDLCIFGEKVTPNEHKFVNDFTLLDNTYCCSILSADGHNWTDSGIATDYLEREFAGWPRSYPAGGGGATTADALAYSPEGFIWNDAAEHGKSVADFGEFTSDRHYWKNSDLAVTNWTVAYHDFISGSNNIVYTAEPDIETLRPYVVTNYIGFDLNVPDVTRAAAFVKDMKQYEAAGSFPNFVLIWIPDDHTSGTKFGSPTPRAQAADNDLAFGQIVEAVSHSQFWSNTCIFGIEDDPQDGWDHVSGYRTTAYVISPYTKRHAVVNTQYNTTSLLRTIELILGLPPMTQMDATATPMFDCFTDTPDFTPYDAVTNNIPLDEMNPKPKKIRNETLRNDAVVSAKLPLDKEDQCPEDLFNHILWRAAKGPQTPYPAQFVKQVDDDD
ncbi:MAG TPA: bifunctional YncE family protein/alkaline phosphatase family protein [Pseudomonadales bacterium]|nr:bifunctional YncE family protein/alkaline phosphatase family protein [Pseudomonadales bacterium]